MNIAEQEDNIKPIIIVSTPTGECPFLDIFIRAEEGKYFSPIQTYWSKDKESK
jgi:hypothetical protein